MGIGTGNPADRAVREQIFQCIADAQTVVLCRHVRPDGDAVGSTKGFAALLRAGFPDKRVLVINNGVIVADDSPESLSANIAGNHKLDVQVAGPVGNVGSVLRSIDGVKSVMLRTDNGDGTGNFAVESAPNADIRKPMFFRLAEAGYPILSLKPLDMSLEDIFVRLTAEEVETSSGRKRRVQK